MGRYSRNLHLGRRNSLRRLKREIFKKNKKNNLEIVCNEIKEEKVIYCHSNMPTGVQYMEGSLEIKPSVLREYLNELERAYRRIH